jgi:hypothetical protein
MVTGVDSKTGRRAIKGEEEGREEEGRYEKWSQTGEEPGVIRSSELRGESWRSRSRSSSTGRIYWQKWGI